MLKALQASCVVIGLYGCATLDSKILEQYHASQLGGYRVVGALSQAEDENNTLGALYRSIARAQNRSINFVLIAANDVILKKWLDQQHHALHLRTDQKLPALQILTTDAGLAKSIDFGKAAFFAKVLFDFGHGLSADMRSAKPIAEALGISWQFIGDPDSQTPEYINGNNTIMTTQGTLVVGTRGSTKLYFPKDPINVPLSYFFLGALHDQLTFLPSKKACGQVLALANPILGLQLVKKNPNALKNIPVAPSEDELSSAMLRYQRQPQGQESIRVKDFNMRRPNRAFDHRQWEIDEWVYLNLRVALDVELAKNKIVHGLKTHGECLDEVIDYPILYQMDGETGEALAITPPITSSVATPSTIFALKMPEAFDTPPSVSFSRWIRTVTADATGIDFLWIDVNGRTSLQSLVWILPP